MELEKKPRLPRNTPFKDEPEIEGLAVEFFDIVYFEGSLVIKNGNLVNIEKTRYISSVIQNSHHKVMLTFN